MKKTKKAIKLKTKKIIKKPASKPIPEKPATKTVQKKGALTKLQDTSYWINRPLDDKERDWKYNEADWITDYVASAEHPHRDLIVEALKKFPSLGGILEVGCSAGPNLIRLQTVFPENQLAGIDVNNEAIERAKANLPKPILKVGSVFEIPFGDKEFDCILLDAVLMYVGPNEIEKAINEIDRVAKRIVIMVERFNNSILGQETGHVWGRNYLHLLSEKGFNVEMVKITKETWPESPNWQKYGRIFIAHRQ